MLAVAYQATIPYLVELNDPTSSWTICTGASGDNGGRAAASMTQGALYSLVNVGMLANAETTVRINEVYLGLYVMADAAIAAQWGATHAPDFAPVYEHILTHPEVKGCRVKVCQPEDLKSLKFTKKFE